jgi:hypothetical protein
VNGREATNKVEQKEGAFRPAEYCGIFQRIFEINIQNNHLENNVIHPEDIFEYSSRDIPS